MCLSFQIVNLKLKILCMDDQEFVANLYCSFLHSFIRFLLFHKILVLHNHTKTQTLLFYLILLLINLSRLVYLEISVFLSFLLLIIFCEEQCSMIIWFWHQIVFHIFHSFSENCIIHQLNFFFKIIFCFS